MEQSEPQEREPASPLGEPERTDEVAALAELAELPVADHIAIFDRIHAALHTDLARIDSAG